MSDGTRELVRLLGTRFITRRDVKAFQQTDGAWYPERNPFTMQDFESHLDGSRTTGHYMLGTEDTCKLFAFDLDFVKTEMTIEDEDDNPHIIVPRDIFASQPDHPTWPSLCRSVNFLAVGLARNINRTLGIPVALAYSGAKGIHVYGFTGEMGAQDVRDIAIGILDNFGCFEPVRGIHFYRHTQFYPELEIEVFPKQVTLDGKDLGNLMALPLGINQRTRNVKMFLREGRPTELSPMDPYKALGGDLPWE